MLETILPELLDKGINVTKLLSSDIFLLEFDYDEWPSNHKNDTACMRPYFNNIFELRNNYTACFPEPEFAVVDEFAEKNVSGINKDKDSSQKISKIKFTCNMLNAIGEYIYFNPAFDKDDK